MSINTHRDIQRLQDQVQKLERELNHLPSRWAGGGVRSPVKKLVIIDGATVYSAGAITYYGIDQQLLITEVASLWDPNGVGTTPGDFTAEPGIGRAYLYIDGVLQDDLVLCVHDTRSGFSYSVITGDPILAGSSVVVPDAGETGEVTLYTFAFP